MDSGWGGVRKLADRRSMVRDLVANHWNALVSTAAGSLAEGIREAEETPEDLVQATLLAFLEGRFGKGTTIRNPLAFVLSRIRLNAMHIHRSGARLRSIDQQPEIPAPPRLDPLRQLLSTETAAIVEVNLEKLPPRIREVLTYRLRGWGTVEIAKALDKSPNTVREQIRRGRMMLRESGMVGPSDRPRTLPVAAAGRATADGQASTP